MKIVLWMNLLIFVCSLIGSIYGIHHFFKEKKALYLKLITCSILCMMFARLFQVVSVLTKGTLNDGFHIGMLGIVGTFMFLFSANYGQMDGLVDDKTKKFQKTRIISLIAPLLVLLTYIFFITKVNNIELLITQGITTLFMMQCSYYCFKHIIIYDVDLGIIRSIRKYNILVLIYTFLNMFEVIGLYADIKVLYIISCILIGIITLILLPILKEGVEKWKI
ncbi:hypothetical protein SAMN05216520_13614 [Kandleria vitulina]|uniref:hypothetical protein n=1 Tax=Kandleria vitulina TaxID=1630 RepID=UPI000889DE1D|nr:hypothetical protein [Kandleria vitulina]SDM22084.1 hypothetical protein SAMN05216520_13614 [Kandleria vitulina]